MKKSFIMYNDFEPIISLLTDEQAGKILKSIYAYVNRNEEPVFEDKTLSICFIQIKQTLIRDLEKYQTICEKNKENIGKRWNTTNNKRIPRNTKNTDSDTDNVSDNKKKKILFSKSIIYDKHKFKEAFDWPKDKLAYYYASADAWSNEGNKKIDWVATIKTWARRDELKGEINFTPKPSYVLQGHE